MKQKIFYIAIYFGFLITINNAKPILNYHSYEMFYSSLKPYGEWINLNDGIIAWRPISIHIGWKPYLFGRWCWTKHGWYWDSYEPFGWAVYHYGRWFYDDYYGWIWIPDNQWGPAWVEWRYDDYYIGWAPLPPYAFFRIDIGIHFSIGWNSHYTYWNFVRYEHFYKHHVNYFVVNSRRVPKIFERTKYRNDYYYREGRIINAGIDRSIIERKSRTRIAEYDIYDVDDYKKIERIRDKDRNKIYSVKLTDRNYKNFGSDGNIELRRAERKSSLRRDRIIFSDNEPIRNTNEINNVERKKDDVDRFNKQETRIPDMNRNYEEKNRERLDKSERSIERNIDRENSRRELSPKIKSRENEYPTRERRMNFDNRNNEQRERSLRRLK